MRDNVLLYLVIGRWKGDNETRERLIRGASSGNRIRTVTAASSGEAELMVGSLHEIVGLFKYMVFSQVHKSSWPQISQKNSV